MGRRKQMARPFALVQEKAKPTFTVGASQFKSFLDGFRDEKYSKWIHLEPVDSPYEEVTIIQSPSLEYNVYIKRFSWKDEIEHSLNFADYDEMIDFLKKNKVRKVKHIATL